MKATVKKAKEKRTMAQLEAAVAREQKAELAAYLKRWTAFIRNHMREYDKRRACTIRARP